MSRALDPDSNERPGVYHYRLHQGQIHRYQPVAENARDFLDEWIQADWNEAADWTARPNLKGLAREHDILVDFVDKLESKTAGFRIWPGAGMFGQTENGSSGIRWRSLGLQILSDRAGQRFIHDGVRLEWARPEVHGPGLDGRALARPSVLPIQTTGTGVRAKPTALFFRRAQARSKRSRFITLVHAATKSFANFSLESAHA